MPAGVPVPEPDLLDLAVKHLRGCGFDARADAVADLAEAHRIAATELERAVAIGEQYRVLLEAATPYRDMWALQLQISDGYRQGLQNALRAGTLADAKSAVIEALR